MKADLQDKNACDALWNEADLVISCGGTFDERRTVDYWCVELTKPLIEAAVDGMKGQVESVVSNKTVNYSSNGSSIYRLMLKSTLLNNGSQVFRDLVFVSKCMVKCSERTTPEDTSDLNLNK